MSEIPTHAIRPHGSRSRLHVDGRVNPASRLSAVPARIREMPTRLPCSGVLYEKYLEVQVAVGVTQPEASPTKVD